MQGQLSPTPKTRFSELVTVDYVGSIEIVKSCSQRCSKNAIKLSELVKILTTELAKGSFKECPEIWSTGMLHFLLPPRPCKAGCSLGSGHRSGSCVVSAAMADYDANCGDWERYSYWIDGKYTQNLIVSDPNYGLMLLCWNKEVIRYAAIRKAELL